MKWYFMKIIQYMWAHFLRYKRKLLTYILLNLALLILSLLTPHAVGRYLDSLLVEESSQVIWKTVSALAIFWTLQLAISYTINIISTELNSKVCFQIQQELLEHLSYLPIRFFSCTNSAYLNQRVHYDPQTLTYFILGDVFNLIGTIITLVSACIILLHINAIFLVLLLVLIPAYILVYAAARSPLYTFRFRYSEENANFYSTTNRLLTNIRTIKMHEWQSRFFAEIGDSFSSLYSVVIKNAKLGYILSNIDALIRYAANIGIFVLAGYQILNKKMTVGEFTMVNSYCLIIISGLSSILAFGKSYRHTTVAYDRIMDLLREEEEHSGELCPNNISEISIQGLSFGYEDTPVISDLSYRLRKGNIYALVGENGSGKSTLLTILCGLEQNYSGRITYGGINLKDLNLRFLREHVLSIVEQEPTLVFKTLRTNITQEACSDETLAFWLNRLSISDLVSEKQNGLDYTISEGATNLSGGQKQRISLVRAIIKNSEVLILDEPTSALDKETTDVLCEILQEIKKDKIVIIVTHSQKIVEKCDETINLSK